MKILIGPLTKDIKYIRWFLDVNTYEEAEKNNNIKFFWKDTPNVINFLKEIDWYPDLIIIWHIEYQPIPLELYTLQIPILGHVLDCHNNFQMLFEANKLFDYIIIDSLGAEKLKNNGINNVIEWNFNFSYDKKIFNNLNLERIYDICFIGNMNFNIHQERNKWVYRLLNLREKYNIKLSSNIHDIDYVKALNQSKISFNYSIRGEINIRTYEAIASKSLLFIEEENNSVKKLFNNNMQNFVYYNEKNFEEKLDYYLKNNYEREKITNNAFKEIIKYDFISNFNYLLELIKSKDIIFKENKTLLFEKSFQAIQTKHYSFAKDIISKEKDKSPELLNEMGLSLICIGFKFELDKVNNIYFKKAINYLHKALKNISNYVNPLYNLAKLYFYKNEYDKSIKEFEELILLIKSNEYIVKGNFLDLIYENNSYVDIGYSIFKIEKEKVFYKYTGSDNFLSELTKLLLWDIYINIGYCFAFKKDLLSAESFFLLALEENKSLYITYELIGELKSQKNDLEQSFEFYKKAIELNPLKKDLYKKIIVNCEKLDNLKKVAFYKQILNNLENIDT